MYSETQIFLVFTRFLLVIQLDFIIRLIFIYYLFVCLLLHVLFIPREAMELLIWKNIWNNLIQFQ